jgi:hypothetical protein
MAWKNVLVKEGGKEMPAVMQDDVLELPNFLGKEKDEPTTIVVDGKSYKVVSVSLDTRDDILKLKLELPMGSPTSKAQGESNGKSNEGSD